MYILVYSLSQKFTKLVNLSHILRYTYEILIIIPKINHHNQPVLIVQSFLILLYHQSLPSITPCRSSRLHPVSTQS